ncbi:MULTISPECIES: hypothetical protein [unclassified Exiguobacterium]|uniref:hypothetical protein n=1 Tax=unclassified Exiguobacterium TaxID=2644629 RepID=UPI00103C848C|nr:MULTISPECIES: hypothetical protein [unclassified Exiguobacterium]TCI70183.1 hypothetical protein EVJ19_07865 [Exiguobacterium sp. IPCI3]TCI79214.1 hypothetical protein EVJ18_07865 [Exiguobacterium sp. IPCH1]TCI81690.1 hypothetical protein EVJ17_07865 [Exiguobacterium sp. IPBC4]
MNILTVNYLEITFEPEGTGEETRLQKYAADRGLMRFEVIEDSSFIGDLHYYVHYTNGEKRKITRPKNELGVSWGYVADNFMYTWVMIYEWLYKVELGTNTPLKRYSSLYEMYEELLPPKEYEEFKQMPVEEITTMYGSPWEPQDEIARNEQQMKLFLEDIPPNSKELIRDEGRFYDYFLEEWIDVKGSIEVFNNLNLGIHHEDKWLND